MRVETGVLGWRGWLAAALGRDPATTRLERDLRRHFPHQHEWLQGLARHARVPLRALLHSLARDGASPDPTTALLAGSVAGIGRLACCAPPAAALRRVEPEGRFRSLELALPSATAPRLGVNEAGLTVATLPGSSGSGRFAPPATLFARDCLERFDCVDAALEWCLSRPAAPGGALLLADTDGELAGVDMAAPGRRTLRPVGGWLGFGLDTAASCEAKAPAEAQDLESVLTTVLAGVHPEDAIALASPERRALRIGTRNWVSLD